MSGRRPYSKEPAGKKSERNTKRARNNAVPPFTTVQRRAGAGAMANGTTGLSLLAMAARVCVLPAANFDPTVCDCSANFTCSDVAVERLLKFPNLRPADVLNSNHTWRVVHHKSRGCKPRNLQQRVKLLKVRADPRIFKRAD